MNMMFNLMAVFKNTVKNNEEILGQEITVNNREEYLGEQITNASDTIAGAIEKMDMTVTKYIEDTRLNEKTAIDWPGKFIVVYNKCISLGPDPKVSESRRRTYIRQVQSFINELKVFSSIIKKEWLPTAKNSHYWT